MSPLTPAADLARLHGLEVAARVVAEGLRSGLHRSRLKGHSVDFADHRAYVPGDDLRHLDWKVLGRSDRLVLKRFEAETDLAVTLCVDGSASMAYQGERALHSKFRYASMCAAVLACVVLDQRDRAGLVLFDNTVSHEIPPALDRQLGRICRLLEAHAPAGGTDVGSALQRLAAPAIPRGLVILISDLLDDPADSERLLDRLHRHGHDVAVLWLLDPDEADLALSQLGRFQGLEGGGELVADPRQIRASYLAEVERQRLALRTACHRRHLAFAEATTGEPVHTAVNRLLAALHDERR